jgi:hypothetical protein
VRDRVAGLLFRCALRLASDRHAYWLFAVQREYWRERGMGGL